MITMIVCMFTGSMSISVISRWILGKGIRFGLVPIGTLCSNFLNGSVRGCSEEVRPKPSWIKEIGDQQQQGE